MNGYTAAAAIAFSVCMALASTSLVDAEKQKTIAAIGKACVENGGDFQVSWSYPVCTRKRP